MSVGDHLSHGHRLGFDPFLEVRRRLRELLPEVGGRMLLANQRLAIADVLKSFGGVEGGSKRRRGGVVAAV